MSAFKERLLTNWHVMRILRLGIAIWLIVAAVNMQDWMVGLFGAFFLYQAATDTGCCGAQGCYNPPARKRQGNAEHQGVEEIEYEELKK